MLHHMRYGSCLSMKDDKVGKKRDPNHQRSSKDSTQIRTPGGERKYGNLSRLEDLSFHPHRELECLGSKAIVCEDICPTFPAVIPLTT